MYVRCRFTTPRWGVTRFYQCLRLCSCGTKPQRSENHHFVMTSSWEPQCLSIAPEVSRTVRPSHG